MGRLAAVRDAVIALADFCDNVRPALFKIIEFAVWLIGLAVVGWALIRALLPG